MDITVRPETAADIPAIRHVNQQAFGTPAEANLVDALRTQGHVRLSLVAVVKAQVVGHVLFSPLPIANSSGSVAALALAPVAVLPQFQRQGVGSQLIEAGLKECAEQGEQIVIVLGEPAYYGRFGFSAKLAKPLQSLYAGPYFQALELVPGALQGIAGAVEYPPAFASV